MVWRSAIGTLLMAVVCQGIGYAGTQSRATTFAGVRYGASPEEFARAVTAIGFEATQEPSLDKRFPHDQYFEGTLKGEKVYVITLYSNQRTLEKVIIRFATADKDCLDFYQRFKGELQAKYGDAAGEIADYKWPYDDGSHVGHEQTAIRNGKATISTYWKIADVGEQAAAILKVTDKLTVDLIYESGQWDREADRRIAMANAVF
jgi:hypothetical protein